MKTGDPIILPGHWSGGGDCTSKYLVHCQTLVDRYEGSHHRARKLALILSKPSLER
jgi:hypothetical protein